MRHLVLLALVGCAGTREPGMAKGGAAALATRPSLRFGSVAPPADNAEKARLRVAESYTVAGAVQPLRFQPILRSGDRIGDLVYGDLVDARGAPLLDAAGRPVHCPDSDSTGLLRADRRWFLVQHLECMPGGVALTGLDIGGDGTITPRESRLVDFAPVGGGINPCAGQITPWSTHLGSEEFEPNARVVRDATVRPEDDPFGWREMARYRQVDPSSTDPYAYGWTPEVWVTSASGEHHVVKHKALGRFSHEIALVLPDRQTVYLSDDNGSGGGLFRFVADKAGDLSAGRLYAARWEATGGDAMEHRVTWVDLGHATDASVDAALTAGPVRFEDLFDAAPVQNGACPSSYASVLTANGHECLSLKPGSDVLASRLETRRVAALRGATTEFEKGEGLAFDPVEQTLYFATSRATTTMTPGDVGGPDHLRLPPNPCGIVWALSNSATGALARAVVAGVADGEQCSWEGISNPDNLAFIPEAGVLLIAEDSKRRPNVALWAYDVRSHTMDRVLTAPWGGEVTGIQWFPDVEGHGFLTVVIQHPFGEGSTPPGFAMPPGGDRSITAVLGPIQTLQP